MLTAERWVSVDEVCSHLDVNKDTIYRWVETKNFPAHKAGRLLRFRISEVDDWVKMYWENTTVKKVKEGKLIWSEKEDFKRGKRRFKSDLVPADLLIARYFGAEREVIIDIESKLTALEQELNEKREEHSGEEGLLAEVIEGEGDKQKITAKGVKARLKEIGNDPDYDDERQALQDHATLLERQANIKIQLKTAQEDLENKIVEKYPRLTESEIKSLVVNDKWLASIAAAVQGELDRVSQTLTSRIRELAERYETLLPKIEQAAADFSARVEGHLQKMGFQL